MPHKRILKVTLIALLGLCAVVLLPILSSLITDEVKDSPLVESPWLLWTLFSLVAAALKYFFAYAGCMYTWPRPCLRSQLLIVFETNSLSDDLQQYRLF